MSLAERYGVVMSGFKLHKGLVDKRGYKLLCVINMGNIGKQRVEQSGLFVSFVLLKSARR